MKKKMIALLAGVLLTLGASNAMAYFEDFELVRVVYNTTTFQETVTDLGNVQSLISQANATGSVTVGNGADAFTSYAGTGASDFGNLMVAYLAVNTQDIFGTTGVVNNNLWFSVPVGGSVTAANGQFNTLVANMQAVFAMNYGYENTTASTRTSTNDINGYYNSFSNGDGQFAHFYFSGNGEASLATITAASIQQGLLYWADGLVGNGTAVGNDLRILTNADGSTTITASNVPIPAAAWLLGSGLMGLVGIRRRMK